MKQNCNMSQSNVEKLQTIHKIKFCNVILTGQDLCAPGRHDSIASLKVVISN